MSKVIAINGSPRLSKGTTAMVLGPFIKGMTDAGAEVELLYASRIKAKPCNCGTMSCWAETPGECCIKDGMESIYPKMKEAEVFVLATPVYSPLPGEMQNFINRLCPLIKPDIENRNGRTRARFRDDVKTRKIVLVATGGWWEIGNFGTVVRIAEELAQTTGTEFAGAVLRPHAGVMFQDGKMTVDGNAVLEKVQRAGFELVSEGMMRKDTLEAVSRPLIPENIYRDILNQIHN